MSSVSVKRKVEPKKVSNPPNVKQKTCFVIMPIADHPDYPVGHFTRVYEHIIIPACIKAGFVPDRADDAQHTHVIMMNILQRILDADMALCDLSSINPNVMYELGIRQAFDKPVSLIKDEKTIRVFDTGMLSDVQYNSDLRVDNVQEAINAMAKYIQSTYEKKGKQVNSLIQLMKIQPAETPKHTIVSTDTKVVLDALDLLGRRISSLENSRGLSNQPSARILLRERENIRSKISSLAARITEIKYMIESLKESQDDQTDSSKREQLIVELKNNVRELDEVQKMFQSMNFQIHINERLSMRDDN